ncbi:MAG: glycosyltransferase family 1 protein [Gemmatimonadaceae bacterium]|nr:glycosyltransferase family 1 protein [Gemmatimonadaceae bacterium]
MRILFCTDSYPPQVNGVSVVTALSVEGLRARGWDCEVVAPRYPAGTGPADQQVIADDPRTTSLPSAPLPCYREIRLALPRRDVVRHVVDRFTPDLIHASTEFVIGRLGASIGARRGIPLCTSYHTDFAKYTDAYGVGFLRERVRASIARFHQGAERIYTPSESAKADLLALGLRDIEVWGRGVDTVLFNPGRRSLVARERIHVGHGFTFLYVGRLAPEKHVPLLLAAFASLARSMPEGTVRLIVAGAGPSTSELRERAGPSVSFLGTLDRQRELPALYASADAFVFASTTETLGLVVLEAMASGLPVIATPAGGVAELLRDEQNGLAFAPGDVAACAAQMRRLVEDRALVCRLREGAITTAREHSWEAELDRLDASYREVLTRPRAR